MWVQCVQGKISAMGIAHMNYYVNNGLNSGQPVAHFAAVSCPMQTSRKRAHGSAQGIAGTSSDSDNAERAARQARRRKKERKQKLQDFENTERQAMELEEARKAEIVLVDLKIGYPGNRLFEICGERAVRRTGMDEV